jgi:beta-phosphoglucomutase family hydrolase
MPNQTGVIFDMDGVLVLTEQAHWESWKAVADPMGRDIQYDTFLSCFGRVNPDCIRILFGPEIPPDESARIADRKEAAFREIMRRHVPLSPGLIEMLAALAGVKLAVGSSGPVENVDLILDAGGIRKFFDGVVHGGDVKRGKPAPDVFLLAAQRCGAEPGNCAVIEDAPAGIQAALAAGMFAVGVATTHDAKDLIDAGANATFKDLASVPLEVLTDVRTRR